LNWSPHNAVVVGLTRYIEPDNDRFTRLVQEYDARKAKYCLQKEGNLIKQNI